MVPAFVIRTPFLFSGRKKRGEGYNFEPEVNEKKILSNSE
jgi:hypothetical protein